MSKQPYELSIKNLVLRNQPPAGQQYSRRIAVMLDGEASEACMAAADILANKVADEKHIVLEAAPLLTRFVGLSAEAEEVVLPIASGKSWDEEVTSFVMKVEASYPGKPGFLTYYIAGYTDRLLSNNDTAIDPDTVFTINSIHTFRTTTPNVPGSLPFHAHLGSAQLLFDPSYSGLYSGSGRSLMRPEDVVNTIDVQREMAIIGTNSVFDTRTVLMHHPVLATYARNDPTIWAESLLEGASSVKHWVGEETFSHITDREKNRHLANTVSEERTPLHPFLRALAFHSGAERAVAQFGLKELLALDAGILEKVVLLEPSYVAKVYNSSSLEEMDSDTIAGHHLINSVPAIMAKHGVQVFSFDASNISSVCEFWPAELKSVHEMLSEEQQQDFMNELKTRVMDVVSRNNQRFFTMDGSFDLFGTSSLVFEFDNQKMMSFMSPTYANSVFSPQVTTKKEQLYHNAETFDQVFGLYHNLP